jgi:hypothetical protein
MAKDQIDPDQHLLFPVRARACEPANLGSADAAFICRCDDGSDYAIKIAGKPSPTTPHTEWLCAHLAELVGLATPPCKVVVMPDNSHTFGSRWETGEVKNWVAQMQAGTIAIDDVKEPISRLFAFDLFVHNGDRHAGNFFFRQQKRGYSLIVMDHSRAWFFNGFPCPALPLPNDCNTMRVHRELCRLFNGIFVESEASSVINAIRKVTDKQISRIISDHPDDWLTADQRNAIMDWGSSNMRDERLDQILDGITNGTYR